jgi:hypothetical protein
LLDRSTACEQVVGNNDDSHHQQQVEQPTERSCSQAKYKAKQPENNKYDSYRPKNINQTSHYECLLLCG